MAERALINVALIAPEIPHNTGNIIRLCANTGARLHLIEPLGFDLADNNLRRASLDYSDISDVIIHKSTNAFLESMDGSDIYAAIPDGSVKYTSPSYKPGSTILFGRESLGLSEEIVSNIDPTRRIRIPMRPANRSLNLSNAVAIIVYEAWRKMNFMDSLDLKHHNNELYFS